MKAFLLAAGVGSRLRPITDTIPKCLAPINGQPLLYYWLKNFQENGVTDVLINLHYLPDKVVSYIENAKFDLKIQTIYEDNLIGSAGTVRKNCNFVKDETDFLICYADNLTNVDLGKMISYHRENQPLFTLGLFRTNRPKECGIAEIDDNNIIIDFVEKPEKPKSDLAGAGIYIANRKIFEFIPTTYPSDFGYDVIPKLIGKMHGYYINEYFIDIGTIDNYEKACREFQ